MKQENKPSVEMVEKEKGAGSLATNPHDSTTVSFKQSLKENYKAVIFSILIATGPMAFGFDIIIVGREIR
ncbi:hypothetical protein EDB81DRAFT_894820 [Dactylonectria macrodidyma]|uniref:Uncharacterized protein n=1 Tax=Dactylonectria macrodidyma TaxID=307937 RepID=A0A9P9I726_9HYPO|nr:hypothetical protein EDB81DRAFT_894820 [Dactylonectria macrodidyma]